MPKQLVLAQYDRGNHSHHSVHLPHCEFYTSSTYSITDFDPQTYITLRGRGWIVVDGAFKHGVFLPKHSEDVWVWPRQPVGERNSCLVERVSLFPSYSYLVFTFFRQILDLPKSTAGTSKRPKTNMTGIKGQIMDPVTRSTAQHASADAHVASPLPKEQDQLTFKDKPTMAFEGHASPLWPQPTHASPVYFYVLFILILANGFSHRRLHLHQLNGNTRFLAMTICWTLQSPLVKIKIPSCTCLRLQHLNPWARGHQRWPWRLQRKGGRTLSCKLVPLREVEGPIRFPCKCHCFIPITLIIGFWRPVISAITHLLEWWLVLFMHLIIV